MYNKKTHRAIVALHISGGLELCEDVLRENLSELNTHLIYEACLCLVDQ